MTSQNLIILLADGLMLPLAVIAAYALLFHVRMDRRYDAYIRIVVVGLTSFLIAKLIGSVFQPADMRPFELMGVEAGASFMDNPGFPSDHVLFATFLTLAVWFETRNSRLAAILLTLTILIGVGRMMALVHTPLDVIGAVAIALLGALWYIQPEVQRITKTISRKKHKHLLQ